MHNLVVYQNSVVIKIQTQVMKVRLLLLLSSLCQYKLMRLFTKAYYNLYMSTGNCTNNCDGQYAFGVLQGFYCWCSNIQPADVLDTSQCSDKCPGYGKETCGNVQSKLFNYFSLGPTPTATEGPITSSTSSSVSFLI